MDRVQRGELLVAKVAFVLADLFVLPADVLLEFVLFGKQFAADFAGHRRLVASFVVAERQPRRTDLAAVRARGRTRIVSAHVVHLDVQIDGVPVAVASIAVVTFVRIQVHAFVDVQRVHAGDDDRLHHADWAGVRNFGRVVV